MDNYVINFNWDSIPVSLQGFIKAGVIACVIFLCYKFGFEVGKDLYLVFK